MRLIETCTCSARFEVEADDDGAAAEALDTWRERHRCAGVDPWARSQHSTTGAHLAFGFRDDGEVTV